MLQAKRCQQIPCLYCRQFSRHPIVARAKDGVFHYRWHEQLIARILENKPDPATHLRQGSLRNRQFPQPNFARLGMTPANQMLQQSGFSRASWA